MKIERKNRRDILTWGIFSGERHTIITLRSIEKTSVLALMKKHGVESKEQSLFKSKVNQIRERGGWMTLIRVVYRAEHNNLDYVPNDLLDNLITQD